MGFASRITFKVGGLVESASRITCREIETMRPARCITCKTEQDHGVCGKYVWQNETMEPAVHTSGRTKPWSP